MKSSLLYLYAIRIKSFFLLLVSSSLLLSSCGVSDGEHEIELDEYSEDSTALAENATMDHEYMADVEIPEGYTILGDALGDLDGDGLDERAIVFNTERNGDMGKERELRIYVDQSGVWSLWHTSVGPVLSSESGGLLGDPFESIEINGGNLIINHYGGSSDRWSYLHEYRYADQNWSLVAATMLYYRTCEYSETYTYDLLKRSGFHSYQSETCNTNGETIKREMDIEESLTINAKEKRPSMDGFKPGETKAKIQGDQEHYYY